MYNPATQRRNIEVMSNIDCDRSALRLNVTDDVHVCWKIITCPVVCDRSMLIAFKRYRRRACLLENHNMSSGVRT